jgi:hypothetical protein
MRGSTIYTTRALLRPLRHEQRVSRCVRMQAFIGVEGAPICYDTCLCIFMSACMCECVRVYMFRACTVTRKNCALAYYTRAYTRTSYIHTYIHILKRIHTTHPQDMEDKLARANEEIQRLSEQMAARDQALIQNQHKMGVLAEQV